MYTSTPFGFENDVISNESQTFIFSIVLYVEFENDVISNESQTPHLGQ